MELVQRKEGKIEECMRIIEELHSKCYRFASMRDGLHRMRARVFDLLTQLRDSEERLNDMLNIGEKGTKSDERSSRGKR